MPSDAADVFAGVLARGGAADAVSGEAWLRAMLDAEAALARSLAAAGLISGDAAGVIVAVCAAPPFDAATIGAAAGEIGNPAGPLVRELRRAVGSEHAAAVHLGATSQDIVDTAAMLVAARALAAIRPDLEQAETAARNLARDHRATPCVARTLLQHAVPSVFGVQALGWAAGLGAARRALDAAPAPAAQLGGAAGTRASWPAPDALAAGYAEALGLH